MKKACAILTIALAILSFSCKKEDPASPLPTTETQELKLRKITRNANQSYEFTYNPQGQLSQVKEYVGNELSTADEILYDNQRRISITRSTIQEQPLAVRYTYTNGALTKTEQYHADILTVLTESDYDNKKRIISETRFEPEGTSRKPLVKYTYSYDSRDNLFVKTQYQPLNEEWTFLRTYTFENYDNSPYVEQAMAYPVMPATHLHRNNYRRQTITNWLNQAEVVNEYAYSYNSKNYPVRKTTHANNGSYDLVYEYHE